MLDMVNRNNNIEFLVKNESYRSHISTTLQFPKLTEDHVRKIPKYLEEEEVAYDIKSYVAAPLGLRIWCGPTIEKEDLECLCLWIEKAILLP